MGFFKDFKDSEQDTADNHNKQEKDKSFDNTGLEGGTLDNNDYTEDEFISDDNSLESELDDIEEGIVDDELLDTLFADDDLKEVEEPKLSKILDIEDKEEVTIITKGTTINGGITSDCSLEVMGTIIGDIECLGKLTITGKVTGNSMASEVYVKTDRLEGSINSEGSVNVALGTVIIGDINASSAVIAGAVKGEIDITGHIVIDSTAIIKGNIKAKSIQMNNGAVIEGFCSLSYADVNIDNIFE